VPLSFLKTLLLIALLLPALSARGQDERVPLDRLLQQAEAASVGSSGADIERLFRRIEPRLIDATARQRTQFELIRIRHIARSGALDEAADAAVALVDRLDELDPDLAQRSLNLATNILVVNGQFDTGFRYFRRALDRAPSVEDPRMRADTYSVAAEFYERIGETNTALAFADRALALARDFDLGRTGCIALERGGRALLGANRLGEAEARFRRAVESCDRAGEGVFEAQAWLGLGRTLQPEHAGEADAALQTALTRFEQAGFPEGVLLTRTVLASKALEAGDRDAARGLLEPVIDRLDRPGDGAARAEAWQLLANLAELDGDTDRALQRLQRAVELRRDRSARERAMRIALLINEQDNESLDRELGLLDDRNRALALESERRRQSDLGLVYGGSGAAFAALLAVVLLVRSARERKRFRALSERDGLTGLFNHTRFFQLAEQAFQRCRQSGDPFTIVVADIDLFKTINDEHGHLAGDAVLRKTGEHLRETFGEEALLGRLGGEEFGIGLPGKQTEDAVARIEHLRALVRRDRAEDEPIYTLSFGVAERVREPELDALFARADQALYDAKDNGRDRVVTVARLALGAARFPL
jgi:diguanylate cyclase (GGDEF)-like protein